MPRWLLGCAVLVLWHASCDAQSTIRLARLAEVPDQFVGGEMLRAVYGRLNIGLEMIDVTGARGLALSSAGLVDGEVHRIAGIERDHPALIRISPAVNYIEPAVFTTTLRFEVGGWDSIKPYNIGIVRGVGSSEAGARGLANVERASDLATLVRMLDADRLDLLVTDLFSGRVMVSRMRLDARIRPLLPPLERIDIYHYLHQRHAELAKRVEQVVGAMHASGELARLREALVERALADARG